MKKKFFNFALKFFKDHKITNKKIVTAVSGGLDSIVLLNLLKELSGPCKLQLSVVHIHHGKSSKKNLQNYRDKAKNFVMHLSRSYNLEFFCPPSPKKELKSEKEFRDFRHLQLQKLLKQKKAQAIALAHNKNDLLESRLIQLIRGCGKEGLSAMQTWSPPYLRPLLYWTRQEITNYALQNKLQWLEDPSNKDTQYLRNWIRKKWLEDLENKRAGAINTLSRSLESLCLPQKEDLCFSALSSRGIKRKLLMEMTVKDQKRVLASYMRKLQLSNYAQSHIEEILKQMERKEKKFSLKILKKTWLFTENYIAVKA